jgi:hypothetical protein
MGRRGPGFRLYFEGVTNSFGHFKLQPRDVKAAGRRKANLRRARIIPGAIYA